MQCVYIGWCDLGCLGHYCAKDNQSSWTNCQRAAEVTDDEEENSLSLSLAHMEQTARQGPRPTLSDGNAGASITRLSNASTGPYGPKTVKWQGRRRCRAFAAGPGGQSDCSSTQCNVPLPSPCGYASGQLCCGDSGPVREAMTSPCGYASGLLCCGDVGLCGKQ